jgi:hypothetical protein
MISNSSIRRSRQLLFELRIPTLSFYLIAYRAALSFFADLHNFHEDLGVLNYRITPIGKHLQSPADDGNSLKGVIRRSHTLKCYMHRDGVNRGVRAVFTFHEKARKGAPALRRNRKSVVTVYFDKEGRLWSAEVLIPEA